MNAHGRLAGMRIAVVDDSPDTLQVVSLMLENEGAQVRSFTDPALALDALGKAPPDVVISDLAMPVMDGFHFVQRLRTNPALRRARLIALSAFLKSPDLQREARKAGFVALIHKPVEDRLLVDAVLAAMNDAAKG